jgi:hypothetical protein
MRDEMRDEDQTTTMWRGLLTGTDPTLLKLPVVSTRPALEPVG